MKKLDIIVPVKNEAENVKPLVKRIASALAKEQIDYNLIFIDDHSTDQTVAMLKRLATKYPLQIYSKQGKPGKAYSILEGAKYAKSENLAMLDADLQYPPEVLPEMFKKLSSAGVVVARRKKFHISGLRKLISKGFKHFFGKLLFNLDVDVQSGLKLFKKEIINHIDHQDVSSWTLDLPLLTTAKDLGMSIDEVEIEFHERTAGKSHVSLIKQSVEIGTGALKLKFKSKKAFPVPPHQDQTMLGSGLIFQGKRFITHTTLEEKVSALKTLSTGQKIGIYSILGLLLIGWLLNPYLTLSTFIAVLTLIYFVDVFFNLYLISKSLHTPAEIHVPKAAVVAVKDKDLPIYTILCPLYKEAQVVPDFIESIKRLDYPKDKLDVKLLLEEDDQDTINTINKLKLPNFVSVVVVPDSFPKTKPKACNYGLNLAKGEYLVIYDAEDRPDPDQLKKAYLAFQQIKDEVVCLQAKLNYYNAHQNLLTRFFTAEYSLWFDVVLPALGAIETNIPLGGTSNHFKTKTLLELKGWDSFNVTEDCDLGVRLFIEGKQTAIINSHTLEEANSNLKNWIRQRSRWIKGYMQTFLVHTRNPLELYRKEGIHALVFQLTVGGKIAFLFINPLLWLATFSYFAFRSQVGSTIETLYSPIVFYMAVVSAVFGNFLYLYYYMIGLAKKGHYSLIKFVFLVPLYWLMGSVAAFMALYQLIFKPHYWEKTVHGLNTAKLKIEPDTKAQEPKFSKVFSRISFKLPEFDFLDKIGSKNILVGGSVLVLGTIGADVANFAFTIFLGRVLSIEEFGVVSLFSSFYLFLLLILGSFSAVITHKISYFYGKGVQQNAHFYLKAQLVKGLVVSLFFTIIWLISIPFLSSFFRINNIFLFLFFAPIFSISLLQISYHGYLQGIMSFSKLGLLTFSEAVTKLCLAVLLVFLGFGELVLVAIPLSLVIPAILAVVLLSDKSQLVHSYQPKFDWSFFISSSLLGISTMSFFVLDFILVKHFLTPFDAGRYALLSSVGKIIFFAGSLFFPFILPLVSNNLGAKKDSSKVFLTVFSLTGITVLISFICLGIFGHFFVPFMLGNKTEQILAYLPTFLLGVGLFTLAKPIINFNQAKRKYHFAAVSFLVCLVQIALTARYHASLDQVVGVMLLVGFLNLALTLLLHFFEKEVLLAWANLKDLNDLVFTPKSLDFRYSYQPTNGGPRILIFNWRDTKHVWAGGAEQYIHQLAKRWVEQGCQVTIFCGNDGKSKRHEILDGVQIIRRGGFYTVYFWAFVYYVIRLRGLFDVVIDSENGIPFFTPLYIRKTKYLLIHHIHQDVFLKYLRFPLSWVAYFLETYVMPRVYHGQNIITVSESSKKDILKIVGNKAKVHVVEPGVDISSFYVKPKTKHPSFLYLGRLKPYKNIDVLIEAFAKVHALNYKATLQIAGVGDEVYLTALKQKVASMELQSAVMFLGKVSDEQRVELFATSWVVLQPSMIEGWGITVIEANACGTPVIASNVNGLRDSIIDHKTGLLVKSPTANEFAAAMVLLLENRYLRNKLAKNAKRWSEKFDWSICSQMFLQLIHEFTHWPNQEANWEKRGAYEKY